MSPRLTKYEREWIASLQKLLNSCPSQRIGFYTIGDPSVALYDRRKETKIGQIMDRQGMDFCQAVSAANAGFNEFLRFPANVNSTAG